MKNVATKTRKREKASIYILMIVAVAVVMLNATRLHAQSSLNGNALTFEVTSVKPTRSDTPLPFVRSPGRFTMRGPLRVVIQNAYQVLQDTQLVGGPRWLASDRFDIVATTTGNPSREQMMLMLRALLADRFRLVVHTETRELPVYALVLAREDRKLGEKLRPSNADCSSPRGGADGPPPDLSPSGGRVPCGMRFAPGSVMAGGTRLTQLVDHLGRVLGRVVIDKTALAGNFDFDLEWTPDNMRGAPFQTAPQIEPVNPGGPSLFTALPEQLGLRLESTRGPVEVVVIDSVARPTPD